MSDPQMAAEIERLTAELAEARAACAALKAALTRLEAAADVFLADQSRATDPRCGLVQPVTVAECESLNAAVLAAREVLRL